MTKLRLIVVVAFSFLYSQLQAKGTVSFTNTLDNKGNPGIFSDVWNVPVNGGELFIIYKDDNNLMGQNLIISIKTEDGVLQYSVRSDPKKNFMAYRFLPRNSGEHYVTISNEKGKELASGRLLVRMIDKKQGMLLLLE